MTQIGTIASISRNEKDPTKINFALQQALQRLGGQQVNRSVTVTTNYSVLVSDYQVNVSGDATITLPAASAAPGQIYLFKSLTTGTTATITPASTADTIDGASSKKLNTQYQTLQIQSNGTTWDQQNNSATTYTSFLTSTDVGTAASLASSSVLQTTNALSELTANSTTARSNIGAAATSQSIKSVMSGAFPTFSGLQTFPIMNSSPYSATLNTFTVMTQGGSVKVTLAINGTPVGGATGISATTAIQTVSLTSANTVSSGDSITIMSSTASATVIPSYTVAYTRTVTLT